METIQTPVNEAEILKDLGNDLGNIPNAGPEIGKPKVQVVPAFLPIELIRGVCAVKNGAFVSGVAKYLPPADYPLLKETYKPSDMEINLYKRGLEEVIFHNFPKVADWFLSNTGSKALQEIILFETVRALPFVPLVAAGIKKAPPVQTAGGATEDEFKNRDC